MEKVDTVRETDIAESPIFESFDRIVRYISKFYKKMSETRLATDREITNYMHDILGYVSEWII